MYGNRYRGRSYGYRPRRGYGGGPRRGYGRSSYSSRSRRGPSYGYAPRRRSYYYAGRRY